MSDVNLKPVSEMKMKILQDPEFGITKTLDDYLKDPKIKNKLHDHDIEDLRVREQNYKIFRRLRSKLTHDLGLTYEVDDLLHMPVADYKRAVPYVLEWLNEYTDWRSKEGVIRSLSTPYAKDMAYRIFIEEFKKKENEPFRWVIGNGLWVFAGDDIIEDLIPLALDKNYKQAREMIVLGLGKVKDPFNKEKVTEVLIELLNDEDVTGHAIEALGDLRTPRAKPHLEKFLKHKKTWWRDAAKNAIKKIEGIQN